MNNIFNLNETVPYDLRKRNAFQSRNQNFVSYGKEAMSYIAPKI